MVIEFKGAIPSNFNIIDYSSNLDFNTHFIVNFVLCAELFALIGDSSFIVID
jgi:hypothetical protein